MLGRRADRGRNRARASGGEPTTLALVQAAVAEPGRRLALHAAVSRTLHRRRDARVRPTADPGRRSFSYLLLVRALAARTAELHRALAVTTGDPRFDPEPLDAPSDSPNGSSARSAARELDADAAPRCAAAARDPRAARSDDARARARAARRRAGAARTRSTRDARRRSTALQHALSRRLPSRPSAGHEERLRHHGSRRRAGPHPRGAAAQRHRAQRRGGDAALVRLRARRRGARSSRRRGNQTASASRRCSSGWRAAARAEFLSAYRRALADCAVYPRESGAGERLLKLATIERLLYEMRYELGQRPDWVAVPLRGLHAELQ